MAHVGRGKLPGLQGTECGMETALVAALSPGRIWVSGSPPHNAHG